MRIRIELLHRSSAARSNHAAVVVRLTLGAIGIAQLLLGVVQISSLAAALTGHNHDPAIGAASAGHLRHESAAWNVAIGAAMAWLAWRHAARPGCCR